MERREFLKGALSGAATASAGALAACAASTPSSEGAGGPAVHARQRVRWRLASSFPRSLDTIYGGAEVLAERLLELTEGRFEIHLHPAGEMVPALHVLDAVQQGTVQAGHTASYYYLGKNPSLAFDTCVPFGMTARQQVAWLDEMGGRELMDELFADFGVSSFSAGNTGVQMGGWFKRPIASLADLKGLKMRIPGLGGKVMDALGASVQVLAGGEIYPALERGVIDATEWVGPYDDEKLGFHQVARHYFYPGWWEPGPNLSFYVNRKAWDELPAGHRSAFRSAAREGAAAMQARYDARNPPALRRLVEGGVEVQPFSEEILAGARDAARQLIADTAAADPTYRRVHEAWEAARRDAFAWFKTAELSYARFAY